MELDKGRTCFRLRIGNLRANIWCRKCEVPKENGNKVARTVTFRSYRLIKVKVKWSRYRPGVAQRVGRGIALLFHDRGTRRG